jgi:aminoglycoside phosphotransferase (APT) family kinase protein
MTTEVRQPIDLVSLSRYIEKNVHQIKCPITIKQFGLGQSNPTYLIIGIDGNGAVCRKKPPG